MSDKKALCVPKLIQTKFEVADTVVALTDVIDFGADPSGKTDSTQAIRDAIDACAAEGGGTIWMPEGQYLVSGTIQVPSLCTLHGDWNDPDAADFNGQYGTVILACPPSEDDENRGLFMMEPSSGITGLTVYYPEQDINHVKPYPNVFYLNHAMLRTLRNVTLINAYRGVGAETNEMSMLRNFKGTCLKRGIHMDAASDVGVFDSVTLTPDYWANAKAPFTAAPRDAIVAWSKANEGKGISIGSAEQQQYSNMTVQGYCYGIYFPVFTEKPVHFMGSGPMYNLNISDCTYGIYAQAGTWDSNYARFFPLKTSIDWRCGYNISCSYIEGDEYAIYNDSTSVFWGKEKAYTKDGATAEGYVHADNDWHTGYVRLADCKLVGKTHGYVIYTTEGEHADLSDCKINTARSCKVKGTALSVMRARRYLFASHIQEELDKVGAAGGGVVYLCAGHYIIDEPLNVPAGVELRGAGGSPQRLPKMGTVIHVRNIGAAESVADQPASVNLAAGAGVSGIFFMYDQNILSIDEDSTYKFHPFTIRGHGKGVYCVNCGIAGCTHGIDFRNCDDHLIEHLVSTCIHETMVVSGSNGLILNCLQNGNLLFRTEILPTQETRMQKNFFGPIGRPTTQYITVDGAKGEQIVNCFIYGGNRFLWCKNNAEVLAVNACSDSLGNVVYQLDGGSLTVINAILTCQHRYQNNGGRLRIYNEMSLHPKADRDVIEG